MSQVTHDVLQANARTDDLTESERYHILEADRRRQALAVLSDRTQPISLEDLATAVAEREGDADDPDQSAISSVATTLHHIHLPKMAEVGVVEYDPEANEISP